MAAQQNRPHPEPACPRALVDRMGRHPLAELGLEAIGEDDALLGRWLVAAFLLSGQPDEGRSLEAYRSLDAIGLADPGALAAAEVNRVAGGLASAGTRDALLKAHRLVRAGRSLIERYSGSLQQLAADCADIEDLAGRLGKLGPGIGVATVARFLRPLRETWPAAREIPLGPAARAAALHLGWLRDGEDEDGEPTALRAFLAGTSNAPSFTDVEAALHRLGTASCRRERPERCPLGDGCPLLRRESE